MMSTSKLFTSPGFSTSEAVNFAALVLYLRALYLLSTVPTELQPPAVLYLRALYLLSTVPTELQPPAVLYLRRV